MFLLLSRIANAPGASAFPTFEGGFRRKQKDQPLRYELPRAQSPWVRHLGHIRESCPRSKRRPRRAILSIVQRRPGVPPAPVAKRISEERAFYCGWAEAGRRRGERS